MLFIEGVRHKLKQAGMTQNELAKKAGLSSSGLSTIMQGKVSPREDSMQAIAQALCCTVASLLEDPVTVLSATGQAIPGLSQEEQILVMNFRKLNPEGQDLVLSYLSMLIEKAGYLR